MHCVRRSIHTVVDRHSRFLKSPREITFLFNRACKQFVKLFENKYSYRRHFGQKKARDALTKFRAVEIKNPRFSKHVSNVKCTSYNRQLNVPTSDGINY